MSVPMIGPGPLEGGPKGSPGPAKNAERFSECLQDECERAAAPVIDTLPSEQDPAPGTLSLVEPPPVNPSAVSELSATVVATGPVVAETVLACLTAEPDSINQIIKITPNLLIVPSTPNGGNVDGETLDVPVETSADEDEGKSDSLAPTLEVIQGIPIIPVALSVPMATAEGSAGTIAVIPDDPAVGEQASSEVAETPGTVAAVSRTAGATMPEFVAPVVEKTQADHEPMVSSDPHRPSPRHEVSEEPNALSQKGEARLVPVLSKLEPATSVSPISAEGHRDFGKPEIAVSQNPEGMGHDANPRFAASNAPLPEKEAPVFAVEKDGAFREALKAVSDASFSLKGSGEMMVSAGGPVSAPSIEKGPTVETVRPAAPVPVLTPSPIELAKQIHVHLESGRSVVQVELHPEHLGELSIALEAKGKDVSMRFTVDNDSARQSVVAGLKELSGSLTTLGWTVNGLAVHVASGGVGNGRSDADGSRWTAFPVNANTVPLEQKSESRPASSGAWRVDLVA